MVLRRADSISSFSLLTLAFEAPTLASRDAALALAAGEAAVPGSTTKGLSSNAASAANVVTGCGDAAVLKLARRGVARGMLLLR